MPKSVLEMATQALPQTCLSTEKHDDRVLDVTLHYFGCLKASEHEAYFTSLPQKSKRRIVEEKLRVRRLRTHFEARPKTENGVALKKFQNSLSDWRKLNLRRDPEPERSQRLEDLPDMSVDHDVKASMIYFKNSRPFDVPGVDNNFPNQKISVKDLLCDEENNPLMQSCDDDMIRYFHFPANNMIWVEEAIARYYHEQRPKPDDFIARFRPQDRTKTQMLLSPEFWKGQQQGDWDCEVHARSMKPLCEVISIDPISTETSPSNLVLFMPYLHWETDRGRMRAASVVKEAGKIRFSNLAEVVDQATANEQNNKTGHVNVTPGSKGSDTNLSLPSYNVTKAPLNLRRAALGRLLRLAANVSEAMNSHVDEKLMYEYLHADPPLQPRRTLDQSYYGALKNTGARDRDQVVYRATTPMPHECDMIHPKDKCAGCHDGIRKVPRLIMVDQLWLWILDEKTIISCFPKRWGKNRADSSAIHKSIRTRLKAARKDEIRTAFDLALIIVDQCSRVFFDRSRMFERQPNLVDLFADAIRGVTYKQTAAFDQFLTYTHLASKEYNSRDKTGNSATQNTLLNINPEGNLLKETKDILDELNIMSRIKIQQQEVAEAFVKHIRHILLPKVNDARDPNFALLSEDQLLRPEKNEALRREQLESAKWTLVRANNLLAGIQSRISELNTLQNAAQNTSAALKDLLTLKQQQAGVVEAREAVKQATETLKQGRSIMLFTVVTIVFLPLSFCASLFGMNTKEFNGGVMTLREEFYYMFPISIAIIGTSFILAFSRSAFLAPFFSLLWAIISYPTHVASTWVLTKTGLYTLSRDLKAKASALKDRDHKVTGVMKANAMREKMELKAMKKLWMEDAVEMREVEQIPTRPKDLERGESTGSEVNLNQSYYSPRT